LRRFSTARSRKIAGDGEHQHRDVIAVTAILREWVAATWRETGITYQQNELSALTVRHAVPAIYAILQNYMLCAFV